MPRVKTPAAPADTDSIIGRLTKRRLRHRQVYRDGLTQLAAGEKLSAADSQSLDEALIALGRTEDEVAADLDVLREFAALRQVVAAGSSRHEQLEAKAAELWAALDRAKARRDEVVRQANLEVCEANQARQAVQRESEQHQRAVEKLQRMRLEHPTLLADAD